PAANVRSSGAKARTLQGPGRRTAAGGGGAPRLQTLRTPFPPTAASDPPSRETAIDRSGAPCTNSAPAPPFRSNSLMMRASAPTARVAPSGEKATPRPWPKLRPTPPTWAARGDLVVGSHVAVSKTRTSLGVVTAHSLPSG